MNDPIIDPFEVLSSLISAPVKNSHEAEFEQELLVRGAIDYCRWEGSPRAIALLEQAAFNPSIAYVHPSAIEALENLAETDNLAAIDSLYRIALFTPISAALQLCLSHTWQPSNPSHWAGIQFISKLREKWEVFDPALTFISDLYLSCNNARCRSLLGEAAMDQGMTYWFAVMNLLRNPPAITPKNVLELFLKCDRREKVLLIDQLCAFSKDFPNCADALAELSIYVDDPHLTITVLSIEIEHSQPAAQAAMLLITGQIDHLASFDFDHRNLQKFFASATDTVQARMLDASQTNGYTQWLETSALTHYHLVADLSDPDWTLLVSQLTEAGRFQELFRLALSGPLYWSAKILLTLYQHHWKPDTANNADLFDSLVDTATRCLSTPVELSPLRSVDLMTDPVSADLNLPSGLLVLTTNSETIQLWDTHHLNLGAKSVRLPSPSTCLTISHSSEYVAIASLDHSIRILRTDSARIIKTINTHHSTIRHLQFSADDRQLASAAFDGTVRMFRIPDGAQLGSCDMPFRECFSLSESHVDGHWTISGMSPTFYRVQLPQGRILSQWDGSFSSCARHIECSSKQILVSASTERTIQCWNPITAKPLSPGIKHESPISGLVPLLDDQLLAVSEHSGHVIIYSIPSLSLLYDAQSSDPIQTLLMINPKHLASIHPSGKLTVWDLTDILASRRRPSNFYGKRPLPTQSVWHSLDQSLFAYLHQNDILLADQPIIHTTDYDILLTSDPGSKE